MSWLNLRARGRGRDYSTLRGVMESVLRVAYRGDWPAALWAAVPGHADVSVARHDLRMPGGTGQALRLAFVSDLHIGPTTPVGLLERAFDIVRGERPDVLLLGGDYVFLDADARRLAVLRGLVASVDCVKLAVLGNHDLWSDDQGIAEALTGAGVRVLVNEVATLPAPWSRVAVIGLDDPWAGRCDAATAAAGIDHQALRIALCHSPDGLLHLSALRVDAFLAGHTHGGQVAAPWGPLILPFGRMCRQFAGGPGHHEGVFVYVSRGLGGVEVPVRTWAPPEVVVLEFR